MVKMQIDLTVEENTFLYNYKVKHNLSSKDVVIKSLITEKMKKETK
jgi:hypothetical protein